MGAAVGETSPGPPQPRPLHDIHKHKALERVFSDRMGTRSELASGSGGRRIQGLLLSVRSGASVGGGRRGTTLLAGAAGVKHVRGRVSCHQLGQSNKYERAPFPRASSVINHRSSSRRCLARTGQGAQTRATPAQKPSRQQQRSPGTSRR